MLKSTKKIEEIESVIAFGGSFASGCEVQVYTMDDVFKNCNNIDIIDKVTKEYSYPNKVAKLLGVPCYNYSMTAGSNDRGLRLLPKALKDHPNSLVLFEWVDTFRKEFYRPEQKAHPFQDTDGFVQCGIHIYNLADKDFVNKPYIEKIGHPYNNLDVNTFYVESACQLYAKDWRHLLFHQIDKFPPNLKNAFVFEGFDNFGDWALSRKFPQTVNTHFVEECHDELARLIYEDLKKV